MNFLLKCGTLYPQMWCGTLKGAAKSPKQPLSFGCLTPSPCSLFFTLIRSFVRSLYMQFGNACCAGYLLCLADTRTNLISGQFHLLTPFSQAKGDHLRDFPQYLDYLLSNHKAKVIHLLHSTVKETLKNK